MLLWSLDAENSWSDPIVNGIPLLNKRHDLSHFSMNGRNLEPISMNFKLRVSVLLCLSSMCNRLMQPLQYKHSWLTLLSNFEGLNLPWRRSETIHSFWKTHMLPKHGSQVYIVAQSQTDKQFSRARLRNTGRIVSETRWGKSRQQVWTR